MIRVEDLHKRFGSLRAVDGISFEVPEGQLFGFLGPNGAGKTTTMSMISGLLKPDQGSIRLGEIDVWESPKAAKRLLGLVPQDIAVYEWLSARENLMFWGSLFDLPRTQLKSNVDLWLKRVGLTDRAKEPVTKFSGGMKRRLNLAIGLVHNPKVVLLDELQRRWQTHLKKRITWFTYLASNLYGILFFLAGLITVAGFVRMAIKKRQYGQEEESRDK